jgi:ribokinase
MVLAQLEIPLETVEYLARICARENVPLILDPAPARICRRASSKTSRGSPQTRRKRLSISERNHTDRSHPQAPAEIAKRFLSNGCRGVVLKMGAHGTYLANRRMVLAVWFPRSRSMRSIQRLPAMRSMQASLPRSCWESRLWTARFLPPQLPAISVTRKGAQPSMPSMAEVEEFLKVQQSKSRNSVRMREASLLFTYSNRHRVFRVGPLTCPKGT